MRNRSESLRRQGKRIAFVPTMGYLHDGHLSLVQLGRGRADDLVVSIFVNPTQFGPTEDLDKYPRNLERDLDLIEKAGVDAVFIPDTKSLYGENFQTFVTLERIPSHLCGLSRPVFFRGVATVVTKLFHIVMPHVAVFGEKDFQQLQVIRQMVRDLDFGIEIVGGPTVREADGLAMSSRNAYLMPDERPAALTLYRSLTHAQKMVRRGERSVSSILSEVHGLIGEFKDARIDYVSIFNPDTFEEVETVTAGTRMALAVWVGKARLIDNMAIG
jgi:pantoate--beta-alanine ligase